MRDQQSFSSKHFRLERLADGVYAAIHVDGGWAQSNAGIIDLGDRTLIFDTFINPKAATDLRAAAEELTGRSIDAVINSHYHNDHIWGNQIYRPDTDIISTTKTRELITTEGVEEYNSCQDHSQQRLEELEAQLQEEPNEAARRLLSYVITYCQAILATMPMLEVRLPNLTFSERLVFRGSKRLAELITFGGGHTGSDAVLYLPDERIVFMADLLFIGVHPYLADGDPDETLRIIGQVMQLDPKNLVPGHGPVGTIDHLKLMVQYIDALNALVQKMLEDGATEEEITKSAMPETYKNWMFPSFFPQNMKFLYQRLLSKRAGSST